MAHFGRAVAVERTSDALRAPSTGGGARTIQGAQGGGAGGATIQGSQGPTTPGSMHGLGGMQAQSPALGDHQGFAGHAPDAPPAAGTQYQGSAAGNTALGGGASADATMPPSTPSTPNTPSSGNNGAGPSDSIEAKTDKASMDAGYQASNAGPASQGENAQAAMYTAGGSTGASVINGGAAGQVEQRGRRRLGDRRRPTNHGGVRAANGCVGAGLVAPQYAVSDKTSKPGPATTVAEDRAQSRGGAVGGAVTNANLAENTADSARDTSSSARAAYADPNAAPGASVAQGEVSSHTPSAGHRLLQQGSMSFGATAY